MQDTLFQALRRFDEERPSLPAEHWLTLAAGVGLWLATRRHPSMAVRLIASLAGTVLVARAVTGSEVPPLLTRLPFADRPTQPGDLIG